MMPAAPDGGFLHASKLRASKPTRPRGVTLVELMIAMMLGMAIILLATSLLLSTRSAYSAQSDEARIEDTGRYAIETLSRAVRQASFENWDKADAPIVTMAAMSPNLAGLDARSLRAGTPGIDDPLAASVNGSDVLAVRFFGAGSGAEGDGSLVNCAGFGVAAAAVAETADTDRGTSIFYVANDATGEPELYCKFEGNGGWTAQSIARGVESFQVLYGLDLNGDSLPDRFATAGDLNALDDALVLVGDTSEERSADRNRKTHWKKVVTVRLALLVHGSEPAGRDRAGTGIHLFGQAYADSHGRTDAGTSINEATLPRTYRDRNRRVFSTVVQVRNQGIAS